MGRNLPLSITLVALVAVVAQASAQSPPVLSTSVPLQASAFGGRLQGTVQDELGAGIIGVSILAVGTTLAVATSDGGGRFSLALPAGEYVLRAAREGYVSTYREPVRIQANALLERNIKLIRVGLAVPAAPLAASSNSDDDDHGHGEIAWLLRHLSRTVLRDVGPAEPIQELPKLDGPGVGPGPIGVPGGWVNSGPTTRGAATFLANTDFSGQLNLLTSGSLAAMTGAAVTGWSRSITDAVIGAPFGTLGDWSVRGAVASGDSSSWTLLGEYQARSNHPHGLRLAVSYSTQAFATGADRAMPVAALESRSVGGIHASDRWLIGPALEVDYAVRFDHYDYLARASLLSPTVGARVRIASRTHVTASTAERMIAPGADQFLPPTGAGPWLPPERTFSSLNASAPLRPEEVRHDTVGLEQGFGHDDARRVGLEWFEQSTTNQMATLFGLDQADENGHYYVATAGSVDVIGWRAHADGELLKHVRGRVEYAQGQARWSGTRIAGALRSSVPLAARHGPEQVHDLRTSIEVTVPDSSTRVTLDYRLSRAVGSADLHGREPIEDGRFGLELRQLLPFQPLRGGTLNLLFTLRTLLHDDEAGSIYDELLTVHPPARLTGGLQVRF